MANHRDHTPHTRIPLGCWQRSAADGKDPIQWNVLDDRHGLWNGDPVEFQLQGQELWILEADDMGTRWTFDLQSGRLRLFDPEGFQYLGEGRYIYFDFGQDPEAIELELASRASGQDVDGFPPASD